MGFFGQTESQRWWRDGEHIPKNSRWLLESLQGVHGTVESIVKMIEEKEEEDTDAPANQTEMRNQFVENIKEMFKAYFELVEQHDRLVGANNTLTMGSTQLSNQQKSSSPSVNQDTKPEARMQLLKENEIQDASTQYNGLAERLHNVESELSKIKVDWAKKEDLLFISEKLNHQQQSNLELQEKELKQKRAEIERLKHRMSELEMYKNNLDNKMSVLEEENKYLNIQNVSHEEKISHLLKDLSLLNETKESLEKEVVLHLRDKENLQWDLSSQISEASKANAMHKGELRKCEIEKEILSEKNSVLESTLLKANIEFDALKEKVLAYTLQIHLPNETIEEAECAKLEAKSTIDTLNANTEQFNVQKSYSGLITYDLLIRTRIWKEFDVFLNKMPIWRKMKDRIERGVGVLKEGLSSTNGSSWLIISFFIQEGSTGVLDSSHSNSKNDPSKIKDGSDVELKEVGRLEMEMQEEEQSKREGSKKITELRQQKLKEQDEAEDRGSEIRSS